MDVETTVEKFKIMLNEQPDVSPAIAALTLLLEFLEKDTSAKTLQGLSANIGPVVDAFMRVESVVTSVKSASELFLRFITFTSLDQLDQPDFSECKATLCSRGEKFLGDVKDARKKIAKNFLPFIAENSNYLIHSHSRVVFEALVVAHNAKKNFHVYVTESAPDYSGKLMYEKLKNAGINCTLIIDAAACSMIEKIDVVILGAESVTANGGIINKIGTYSIAHMANFMKKRVFVLAESFKFTLKISPVNQRDLANELLQMDFKVASTDHPIIDYTPPKYITLLITNVGKFPTSAVYEELSKLYL